MFGLVVCFAKCLKLRNSRALVLVNRLRIRLENARAGMAHHLSHEDVRDARLSNTARKGVPQVVNPEMLKASSAQRVCPGRTNIP